MRRREGRSSSAAVPRPGSCAWRTCFRARGQRTWRSFVLLPCPAVATSTRWRWRLSRTTSVTPSRNAMREAISSALLLDDASDDGRGGVRGVVGGSCFRGGRRDGDDDDAGCSELLLGRSADSVNNAASGEFDPGRAGATVSPEPQADTLRRKRISGSNITPAGPGSNSPDDDDRRLLRKG